MMTQPDTHGIRKAAIFVASLDRKSADLVLDQMPDDLARAVRQAILDLDAIDPEEQRSIVAEFRRRREPPKKANWAASSPPLPAANWRASGVEIDPELAKKFVPPPLEQPTPATNAAARPAGPLFRFLCNAEADKLARVLATERPQTIALVLSHLPPQHAGSVLARLEAALQVDVVRRLVELEETDPEILREVERGLEIRLSKQVPMQRRRVAGMAAVAGILEACDRRTGDLILDNLELHDRELSERLKPAEFAFDDLAMLDDDALSAVLHEADSEWIQLALVGARPEWIQRFLSLIPDSQATRIRSELNHLGPTRLSDVEEARLRLAALAERLVARGRVRLPRRPLAAETQSHARSVTGVASLSLAGT